MKGYLLMGRLPRVLAIDTTLAQGCFMKISELAQVSFCRFNFDSFDSGYRQKATCAGIAEGTLIGSNFNYEANTFLIDVKAVKQWFAGYGKGIDAFRATQLNPDSDNYYWYTPLIQIYQTQENQKNNENY